MINVDAADSVHVLREYSGAAGEQFLEGTCGLEYHRAVLLYDESAAHRGEPINNTALELLPESFMTPGGGWPVRGTIAIVGLRDKQGHWTGVPSRVIAELVQANTFWVEARLSAGEPYVWVGPCYADHASAWRDRDRWRQEPRRRGMLDANARVVADFWPTPPQPLELHARHQAQTLDRWCGEESTTGPDRAQAPAHSWHHSRAAWALQALRRSWLFEKVAALGSPLGRVFQRQWMSQDEKNQGTDPLTGLANRWLLERELAGQRSGRPPVMVGLLSLEMVIPWKFWWSVQRRTRYVMGADDRDRELAKLAGPLRQAMRRHGLVARLKNLSGGEAALVWHSLPGLAPGTPITPAAAQREAQRILALISEQPGYGSDDTPYGTGHLGIAITQACTPWQGSRFLRMADRAAGVARSQAEEGQEPLYVVTATNVAEPEHQRDATG
ncbi:GGDEF domain-containing protein [Kineosporia babensis]|uniref:GGDEF domain-containing protein n=1 Tax=Kineosporia babensis TaxID=499548 RepID=A0A9X1NNB5_9ACTN|nr:GGDEF domain-containing protein [Kineosporia babensis]MCD5316891.1 GGDEF domain-containing protein [Kineosporia babensis]